MERGPLQSAFEAPRPAPPGGRTFRTWPGRPRRQAEEGAGRLDPPAAPPEPARGGAGGTVPEGRRRCAPSAPRGSPGAEAAQSPIVAPGWPPQSGFCSSANSAAGTADCSPGAGGGEVPGQGRPPGRARGRAVVRAAAAGPCRGRGREAEAGREPGKKPRLPNSTESSGRSKTDLSPRAWPRTQCANGHDGMPVGSLQFAKEKSCGSLFFLPLFSPGQNLKSNFLLNNNNN